MDRSSNTPTEGQERVRTLRAKSPTGQVVVVSRGAHPSAREKTEVPPCLRAHRATRILP